MRWWVPKQVLMWVSFPVFGSYLARWRPARVSGNNRAEGWLDPSLQKAGLSGGRTVEVIQTRPRSSNIGLCTLFLLVQIGSLPQYGDASGTLVPAAIWVAESRTVSGTRRVEWCTGSRTGR